MLELFLSNYISLQSTQQIVGLVKPMHKNSIAIESNTPVLQYSNTGSGIWNYEENNGE